MFDLRESARVFYNWTACLYLCGEPVYCGGVLCVLPPWRRGQFTCHTPAGHRTLAFLSVRTAGKVASCQPFNIELALIR